jgi:lipid A ethanolaminephosphotransferase
MPFRLRLPLFPARPLAPVALALIVALWIATLGNLGLWRTMLGLPELRGAHEWSSGLGFGVLLLALHAALFGLLAWKWTFKPVLIVFVLGAACINYFALAYGAVIDTTMMTNVLLTDTREVHDLLNWRMVTAIALLGLLPALLIACARLAWAPPLRQARRNALFTVGAIVVLVGVGALQFQGLASLMRNHKQVRYLITPLNAVYALFDIATRPAQRQDGPVLPLGRDARLAAARPDDKPPLIIAVVGETARGDHFALNGYARPTNPQLAHEADLVSMSRAQSCGTNTAASVPCMFSNLGRIAFNNRKANTEGLTDVLGHAGLAVLWLDNQAGGCKGVCARVPTIGSDALRREAPPGLCNDGGCYDDVLLHGLDARLAQLPAAARARGVVIFMHTMGSHGPDYYQREPAPFKPFQPECRTNVLTDCSREQILNAFDNTIVYTDHFLSGAIGWLKEHQDDWATGLMYVSDHGESLGENNLYLHGLPYAIAPDVQKHPEWIFWLSPRLQTQRDVPIACLAARRDEAISHDNYFHTLLGLAGVQTSAYDPARDFAAGCRARAGGAR